MVESLSMKFFRSSFNMFIAQKALKRSKSEFSQQLRFDEPSLVGVWIRIFKLSKPQHPRKLNFKFI